MNFVDIVIILFFITSLMRGVELGVVRQACSTAGLLIGFQSEDDWFDYRLESDSRFLQRIGKARKSLQAGRGVKIEDIEEIS